MCNHDGMVLATKGSGKLIVRMTWCKPRQKLCTDLRRRKSDVSARRHAFPAGLLTLTQNKAKYSRITKRHIHVLHIESAAAYLHLLCTHPPRDPQTRREVLSFLSQDTFSRWKGATIYNSSRIPFSHCLAGPRPDGKHCTACLFFITKSATSGRRKPGIGSMMIERKGSHLIPSKIAFISAYKFDAE